jgi:Ca2+-binding RTX toxin-like protein
VAGPAKEDGHGEKVEHPGSGRVDGRAVRGDDRRGFGSGELHHHGQRRGQRHTGTNHRDVICARGGDDTIQGNDGRDKLHGGAGKDVTQQ